MESVITDVNIVWKPFNERFTTCKEGCLEALFTLVNNIREDLKGQMNLLLSLLDNNMLTL